MTLKDNLSTQCEATVILHDDRFGAFESRCELEPGHDVGWGATEHSVAYTATEPLAHLRWTGSARKRPDIVLDLNQEPDQEPA